MKRRNLIAGLGGLAAARSLPLAAQQPRRRPTVAILAPVSADYAHDRDSGLDVVIGRLAELGDINGETVELQFRAADGDYQRLPKLAAELVALNPSVIYTYSTPAARAAVGATSTIPIVIGPVGAATMHALVANFEHPGANVTGLHITGKAEHGKCLEILKELAPGVTRVGVLFNPANQVWQGYPGILRDTAGPLGIDLVEAPAHGAQDIDQTFKDLATKRVDGVFLLSDVTLTEGPAKARVLELIASSRWPSVSDGGDFVADGGLLSLSADGPAIERGAAEYIHRILQGAKPNDLPIAGPKLLISVNLGTAAKLGIAVPQPVLARADRVVR